MRKMIKLKKQTIGRQSCRLYLTLNICRLYGGMMEFGGYSIGNAQIDDESKEKLNFRICPNSTISLLVSRSDMSDMRCFPIGSMKKQHDAILESFGTTEEIIYSLTRLTSTIYSLLSSTLKIFNLPLLAFLNLRNYSKSNFDLAAKPFSSKFFLSQILAQPQNAHQRKYSESKFDLAAKHTQFWKTVISHLFTPIEWS